MARPTKEFRDILLRDHTLLGGLVLGIDGHVIEMQARATEVLDFPRPFNDRRFVHITGMAGGAIQESLDRIGGAFVKLQIPLTPVKIVINLAPAGLYKEGTWLDLPIAILLLLASGHLPELPEDFCKEFVWFGEVGLHGEIRKVSGTLSIAFASVGHVDKIVVPSGNEKEGWLVKFKSGGENFGIYPVKTLQEVIDYLTGKRELKSEIKAFTYEPAIAKAEDFSTIRGQVQAKRAAVISAAGGHNLLLIGPPGEGKSLLASAIPGILPNLTKEEMADLTRIYSACGQLEDNTKAVTRRPMRTIHRSASRQAVIGGGTGVPKPGEITLAHLGVLFMDEFPEFPPSVLESLRAPMESGVIQISRAESSLEFPARFTLVAAMNPCPCGYFSYGKCACTQTAVTKYQRKISGPILDRIDLQVELKKLDIEDRFAEVEQNQTAKYKQIVQRARERQHRRFAGTDIHFNAAIPPSNLRELCSFSNSGFSSYKSIVESSNISTRSVDRLAKVARTIADIEDSDNIRPAHVQEAATFVIGGLLRDVIN
jgi:magnesium chelatase family protein